MAIWKLTEKESGSCPVPSQRDWLDGGAANEESQKNDILEEKAELRF